jgi:hypothetical protein
MANWEDDRGHAWIITYIKGSQAITVASDIQQRSLAKIRAVQKVCEDAKYDSQIALQYSGPLLVANVRLMRQKVIEESIEEVEIRIEKQRIKRENKCHK